MQEYCTQPLTTKDADAVLIPTRPQRSCSPRFRAQRLFRFIGRLNLDLDDRGCGAATCGPIDSQLPAVPGRFLLSLQDRHASGIVYFAQCPLGVVDAGCGGPRFGSQMRG